MGPSRVELFEAIRRDERREGLSVRALAERHGVHRRTVRTALAAATPPPRKGREYEAPKLDPARTFIDAMLREDLTAPRKQRHTARRVLARLVDEHQMVAITYSTVRDYVRKRRPEINAEGGRCVDAAFVPQTHDPGAEAEVDFGDVWLFLDGVKTKCFLFTFRLSYSGKAIHRVYASQGQEAFIEGHLEAFRVLGGVPSDKIRYDNLRAAVSQVLFGRSRVESQRWVTFRSHHNFDAFYCTPGIGGAHEKGGVEGEVGRFRRNHLVPVPRVATLQGLNGRLEQDDADDDRRRIDNRINTVGQDFATEQPLLRALPTDGFEPGLWLTPRVDRYARVTVRMCHYSVPARLIGRKVRVCLRASDVVIYDRRVEVARHARLVHKGAQSLQLDHYLEVLTRKPGALPGATALVQARMAGTFTAAHEAFWAAARSTHGDADGTRVLVEVLLLHRHLPAQDVVAGLEAALTCGAITADAVALEARRAADRRGTDAVTTTQSLSGMRRPAARVASLTQRRLGDPDAVIAGLPADTRPLPSVTAYDELLRTRRTKRLDQPPGQVATTTGGTA